VSAIADELEAVLRKVLDERLRPIEALLAELQTPGEADHLGIPEAAKRLGLATSTIYKLAERCELPSVKLGGRVLFKPADLDAYAEDRRRSPSRVREAVARALGGELTPPS
jgi:excisionase family DNA binding protein